MNDILANEANIRLTAFLTIFLVMALWETIAPYRKLSHSRSKRWPHQLGLIIVNSIVLRFFFPLAAVGSADWASMQSFGLLNILDISPWIGVPLAFLFLDFCIYWQHVIAHKIGWFWKLHRTHHADMDFDLTTGIRFHPLEILLSMLIKVCLIALFGLPVFAVLLFEIALNGSALFNHSNIALPKSIESRIRMLIVTPTMHRIHHSTQTIEHDSNFGFFLSIWDRLFGSYRQQSSENDQTMDIGLNRFRESDDVRLDKILSIPFK